MTPNDPQNQKQPLIALEVVVIQPHLFPTFSSEDGALMSSSGENNTIFVAGNTTCVCVCV